MKRDIDAYLSAISMRGCTLATPQQQRTQKDDVEEAGKEARTTSSSAISVKQTEIV